MEEISPLRWAFLLLLCYTLTYKFFESHPHPLFAFYWEDCFANLSMKWPRTYKKSPALLLSESGHLLLSLLSLLRASHWNTARSPSPRHCFVSMVPHWAWWNTAAMLYFMDNCHINVFKRVYHVNTIFYMHIALVFIVNKEAPDDSLSFIWLCHRMSVPAWPCVPTW